MAIETSFSPLVLRCETTGVNYSDRKRKSSEGDTVGEITVFDLRLPVISNDEAQQLDSDYLDRQGYRAPYCGLQDGATVSCRAVDNAGVTQHRATESNRSGDISPSDQCDLVGWRKVHVDETGDQQHRDRGPEIEKIIEDAAEHGVPRSPVKDDAELPRIALIFGCCCW